MTTSSYVIIAILLVLNIAGLVFWIINNKHEKPAKFWWGIVWNLICGVTYLPYGIITYVKNKKK